MRAVGRTVAMMEQHRTHPAEHHSDDDHRDDCDAVAAAVLRTQHDELGFRETWQLWEEAINEESYILKLHALEDPVLSQARRRLGKWGGGYTNRPEWNFLRGPCRTHPLLLPGLRGRLRPLEALGIKAAPWCSLTISEGSKNLSQGL